MNVPFKIDLKNQVAVVTGGSGVLCSCMAKALAACGARVAVLGRNAEKAEGVAAGIRGQGGEALSFSCDVLDRERLDEVRAGIEAAFGPVTILVNGAGGNHPRGTTSCEQLHKAELENPPEGFVSFFDLDPAGIQYVFNLNLIGTLLPTQVFTRGMVDQGGGVVINIASMNSFKPLTKIPAYSAAKAAVNNFTQWLAVHLAPVNIRVNAIAPGFFLTDQNRTLMTNADGSLTARGNKILTHTPMARFGDPGDLIGTLLWLVSDKAAGFVTGTVIPVDGGFSAYSGV
ncbi:MAG: SDR family oxidoreductase [Lentisphaerae bacterium]|jgi:NAD(P)-dependent dehydrogenase (short-subunit alcohol dehydrogenase family)|nr:SDR family oxidoreductase [Lentisphaerota bacterium]